MFEERKPSDTSKLAMLLFRIGIVAVFFIMVGRMVQLQVMRQDEYRTLADTNRLVRLETAPPRGVIYDRNDTILVRNRPSFEIAVVPADLELDDLDTEGVDEEALEIERVLQMLRADTDTDVALRIGEIMFRKLGYSDFTRTVQNAGVSVTFVDAPAQVRPVIEDDRLVKTAPEQVFFPDLTAPLPLPGLVALVQRAVTIERQGSASDPVPILDGLDRIRAFEISEQSFTLPALRVNQVPVREYIYGELLSHVLGFMGPIPAAAATSYREAGYNDPNEKVGLNGLEYSYQDELRGVPGVRFVERDILGTDMRIVGDVLDPVPGLNLHLSLDRRLQEVMKQELQAAMDETEAPWAVAIAMNPQNGQILGMVSLPRVRQQHLCRTHRRGLSGAGAGRAPPADQLCHWRVVSSRIHLQDGDGVGWSGRRGDHRGNHRCGQRPDLSGQRVFSQRSQPGAGIRQLESPARHRAW
jgi:cell division protein FtsI/penicillin-binding protein 2